jgi:hypothetical protein
MARVLDLGKSCSERRLEHRSRVVSTQLEPGAQTWLLIIRCLVGELDAEVPSVRKADNKHRLIDSRELNGPDRASQDRLKALG